MNFSKEKLEKGIEIPLKALTKLTFIFTKPLKGVAILAYSCVKPLESIKILPTRLS
jgi:hypothetical protein